MPTNAAGDHRPIAVVGIRAPFPDVAGGVVEPVAVGGEGVDRTGAQVAVAEGVLHGEALARAYAQMDLFVFPSLTDTYGNVVLEAMSAGVPAIVTDKGGPQFIVQPGETGYVARNLTEFVNYIKPLSLQPEHLFSMRIAARRHALSTSWDRTFESVYASYDRELRSSVVGKKVRLRPQTRVATTPVG